MLLDQADCTGPHELRRSPNDSTSLYVLNAVDGAEKSLERIDGGVGMVRLQAVSLHVADDERRGCGNVFDAVGQFFQDKGGCLSLRSAIARSTEIRQQRAVWITSPILVGKGCFDIFDWQSLQTSKDVVRRGLRYVSDL
jgi:hypothetical protein